MTTDPAPSDKNPPADAVSADAAAGRIHPDLAAVGALLQRAGLATPRHDDVQATRAFLARLTVLVGRGGASLRREATVGFAVNGRDVPCKLYWPDGAARPPLLFYAHGGGFRHGELEGWDAPLRQVVRDSGCAVLSIGYALAPEYRFPTAFDEVVEIMRRVIAAGEVDGRPVAGFAAGGDSAGANLILGAAVALREAGLRDLRYLMLFYGVYSRAVDGPSWRRLGGYGGRGLSATSMAGYWSSYLAHDENDWRVQPLYADLAGLPATSLVVGELDPLLDENVALADRLEGANVPAILTIAPGIIHGVVRFNLVAPVVRDLLRAESRALGQIMGAGGPV